MLETIRDMIIYAWALVQTTSTTKAKNIAGMSAESYCECTKQKIKPLIPVKDKKAPKDRKGKGFRVDDFIHE